MTLCHAACHVLTTADASEKVRLTLDYAQKWKSGEINDVGQAAAPNTPARPEKPLLLKPRDMPRRRLGSETGRAALIHAIAHIELNAIDLAWDIIVRFVHENLPKEFYDDWVQVADDEAVHFRLLNDRLSDLGYQYGDFPAHSGLWETAQSTSHDLMARCALVPMLLEPRGLDTTPPTVDRLEALGDHKTAAIMDRIAREEIDHVAAGTRWFNFVASKRDLDPIETYQKLVLEHFNGQLKGPFNKTSRDKAGLTEDYYLPIANQGKVA